MDSRALLLKKTPSQSLL